MQPLRIAILWHQHQPYYKKRDEFILPWVRLHGAKDYFDLPEILHTFPEIKQTFNLVPSLARQLDEYSSNMAIDNIQRLSRIPANHLTDDQKSEILRLFFLCNTENMIIPYPRYRELFERSRDRDWAIQNFSKNDWLDLQVWYNLTWIGQYSRQRHLIQRFFRKERNFTESEKHIVLNYHLDILGSIIQQMLDLKRLGQIDISCSPMYHPILPLLCDTDSAQEAMPDAGMPDPAFRFPEDARRQIGEAMDYYERKFHSTPDGMWPSEGSISDEVLAIMADKDIRWAASDEEVLEKSLGDKYTETAKYFPHLFEKNNKKIALLFRDRFLSDRIGFVYSNWGAADAAGDFCHHLNNIRKKITEAHGENALEHAVVPIILDGENCWEFYPENGIPFLTELYKRLSNKKEFLTVTCSEAAAPQHCRQFPPIGHIRAGSWIDANFDVWIGNEANRMAWSLLARTRRMLEDKKDEIGPDKYADALDELMVAEGSDWFWWYCDRHQAENKPDFDVLFRWHLGNIFKAMNEDSPDELATPLGKKAPETDLKMPFAAISPEIGTDEGWDGAGVYDARAAMSEMHQAGGFLSKLLFGGDDRYLYFRLDFERGMESGETAEIRIKSPIEFIIKFGKNKYEMKGSERLNFSGIQASSGESCQVAIPREVWKSEAGEGHPLLQLTIRTQSPRAEIFYPRQGTLDLEF
ncbi:MAG: glycoside hydrolase family 57 protein [Candidatus Kapaibacterium sp.]